MLLKPKYRSDVVFDDFPGWHILNEATQEMKQAKNPIAITRIVAQSLSQIGFQVLVGQLNSTQTELKAKFFSLHSNGGIIYPVTRQSLPSLYRTNLSLSLLQIPEAVVQNGTTEFITYPAQALREIFGADFQWIINKLLALEEMSLANILANDDPLSAIVAPIQTPLENGNNYLILVSANNITPAEIPLITAFSNVAGAMIENIFLHRQTQTLPKASQVGGSNLEIERVLQEKARQWTAEIQKQKEQTHAILESAADAIVITSAKGAIEYTNPAFSRLTGYSLEEATGRPFDTLFSEQPADQKVHQIWHTISAGKTWRGDIKSRRKDGSLYDADFTIAPIFNSDSQVEKFVAIQRDISKKTELDRLKTDFLVTASHELRTPLTTIKGYSELLLNRHFSKSETDHFLRYIHEQATRISNLVSDLLDLSRVEAGATFLFSPKLVNPGPVFKEVVGQWREKSPDHSIDFIQPQSWPEIKVDPDRLKQILNKLLSNAVKYSPEGDDITIRVEQTLTNLHISIADNGIGMTQDEHRHLFEAFWRADASAVAAEGTGLSMVVAKHIIESHGGKIWVSSQRGEGTTVNFTLPLLNGKATILIIEDDPGILEVEENILISEGYHVISSRSGLAGLELAFSQYPDLIVLDLMLPGISGEDILHRLKDAPSTCNIPVVVVSAKSALTNIEYAFTLGAVDFLAKPFDLAEFVGRIKIALLSKRV